MRRARPELRTRGVCLQTHLGILYEWETRKAAGFAETGMCLVSMDVERPVPGNPSTISERFQLGVELPIFPAIPHPTTQDVEQRNTDVRSRSLLTDVFPRGVLHGTQVITVSVEMKQCKANGVVPKFYDANTGSFK